MKSQSIKPAKSMADVIDDIAANLKSHGTAGPEMIRAVRRLGKLLRRDLAKIQASLPVVDAYMASLMWQSSNFRSAKAFANWRAQVRRAVRRASVTRHLQPLLRPRDYPLAWKAWLAEVDAAVAAKTATRWARASVAAVPSWCSAHGVSPTDFDDAAAQALATWWAKNGANNGRRKSAYMKAAICAWNALAALGIGGHRRVRPPVGRPRSINIQLTDMPASLNADIDAYVHYIRTRSTIGAPAVEKPQPEPGHRTGRFDHLRGAALRDIVFDTSAASNRRPLGPVSDSTVSNSLHALRTVVTACVESGRVPLTPSVRLKDFLGQQQLVDALAMLHQRAFDCGKITETTDSDDLPGSYHTIAAKLTAIARWAGVDEAEIKAMAAVNKSPDVKVEAVTSMPAGRRAVLAEMDRPELRLAWFRAPEELWKRAEAARKQKSLTWEAVCDAEQAFISWILTRLPLRRKNIGLLTFKGDKPMIRLGRFDGESSILEVPGRFTKNGRSIRFRLRGEGEAMLRKIIGKGDGESYRDAAMRLGGFEDSDHVFVGNSRTTVKRQTFTGHRALSNLGNSYSTRMRGFGIPATLHVARHICAQIALDHDPSAVALVANLLGDSVRTVERHYLADRTSKAAEIFDKIVQASVQKAFRMLSEGEME